MSEDVFQTLKNMKRYPIAQTNLKRAEAFREYTITNLKAGSLGLKSIKPETIKRRVANLGGPLYDYGELAKAMKAKNIGKDAEAGYFKNDTEMHSNTNITNFDLANIHINNKKRPRPFLLNSANKYEGEGKDDIIIEEEVDKWWESV